MKISRFALLISSTVTMFGLSACDLFQRTVKTEAQLPSDRETVITTKPDADFRSQALERGEVSGYWVISEVAGKKAVGEEPPYLKFDKDSQRVYGNNGCNTLNASYKVNPADSTLSFDKMITTMRACGTPGLSEIDINVAMANTARYTWSHEDNIYTITLESAAQQPLMALVRQSYEFLNGTWTVASLGGKAVNNDDIKLVIDVEEQKIHGNTGCNILNGTLITDMLEPGAITFTNMATTRMMCPDIEFETELLVALEEVTEARPATANTVNMLDAHGNVILTLKRIADTK